MKKVLLLCLAIIVALGLIGGMIDSDSPVSNDETIVSAETLNEADSTQVSTQYKPIEDEPAIKKQPQTTIPEAKAPIVDLNSIPAYSGKAYIAVNNNIPYFAEAEHTTISFEKYSPLDSLGRCGVAFANIGVDIMPTEERGSIGSVRPSGWQIIKYENVDGKYLYNRCHLIGFQLSGENANEQNLITGTRYMNVNGMLPFENMVADYVQETKNHVLYRVTPIFEGNNLLATGVLMEALSMEDNGEGICFNVFCYNEQPGIVIDHSNGDSKAEVGSTPHDSSTVVIPPKQESLSESSNTPTITYIANKNTNKFHYPYCNSVDKMKEKNKKYLTCTRDQAIFQGYSPCRICNP